jgi:hypothetical protein
MRERDRPSKKDENGWMRRAEQGTVIRSSSMNTQPDELAEAIERTAGEVREALRGLTSAAPDSELDDRVNCLLALRKAAQLLKAKGLKRRALPPVEGRKK